MIEERYNFKAIKDHCKITMAQEGYTQEKMARALGYSQQNIDYALREPNRMQMIIFDMFLEMGYEVILTSKYVKINKERK